MAFFCIKEILLMFLFVAQLVMMGQYVRWECTRAKYKDFNAAGVRKFFALLIQYSERFSFDVMYDV